MDADISSENGDLIDSIERLAKPELIEITEGSGDAAELLVVPSGKQIHSVKKYLDEWAIRPDRRKGTARLTTLDSFIGHVNRFKDPNSAVFADVACAAPRLLAVIDYHDSGPNGLPRFGEHRAEYRFPLSKEWEAWTGAGNKGLPQAAFAEFLEEHLADVMDPGAAGDKAKALAGLLGMTLATPQRLLELSRGLSVHVGAAVKSQVNLSSGEGMLSFEEKHADSAGAPLKVPGAFVIAIPVFQSGRLYQLPVRLRYRVAGGQVTWFLSLQRADQSFDHAVNEAAEEAHTKTELTVFYGTPEAP